MRNFYTLFIISAFSFLAGCTVNPVTGEKELSLVSAEQEVAIGEQNYATYQQQQGGAYSVDPELTLYVKSVGQRLAAVSDRPGLPYDFVVLNSDVPNAWALPGGKIAINRGLLVLLDDEAQLAAVLGHEIVHAAARHGAQQMTQQQILGMGAAVAGAAAASHEYGQYIGMGVMGSAKLYQAHYGRSQELQSDSFGMDYMVKAGYEPQAAVELQETFVKLSKGQSSDFLSTLFASHPPSQERVDKNRAKASTMARGKRNRNEYQRAIAQIKKDAPAYKKLQEATQAAGAKDFNKAHSLLNQAIKMQPDEAMFYITKGQIQLQQKQYSQALSTFTKAHKTNPDYYVTSLGLGLAYANLNKAEQAKSYLEKSMKVLPTQIGMFHLGEISLNKGEQQKAAEYFSKVAQAGGELGQQASKKLQQMGYQQ